MTAAIIRQTKPGSFRKQLIADPLYEVSILKKVSLGRMKVPLDRTTQALEKNKKSLIAARLEANR